MEKYDHNKIESRWQKEWAEKGIYKTKEDNGKPKCYVLDMFPYPSGDGLHVGHPKGYIATDVYSRYKQMSGFNILHPMGWDAFGLPAENYAIKNKIHPRLAVEKNIKRFKEQLSIIGFNYDWSREINTTDPKYYKWTQWIFLKMLEKGLAYQSNEPVNWCPSCQTVLANEDLEGGKCERCDSEVEKKPLRQWVLKITDYADRMLEDLDKLDWPRSIKESQKNWIGRSEGAEIEFAIVGQEKKIKVFTTRADTLFGVTYVVLAPEHPFVAEQIRNPKPQIRNKSEVEKYLNETKNKTEIERTAEGKEKTGVILEGVMVTNPANNEQIPVWVADYALANYGTGAVMAVPAHDERDFAFAEKYHLPIIDRSLVDKNEITEKFGKAKVTYKLRDWVFSRQRYWGEPIPVIHCEKCGVVPVPEKDLPVRLPEVEHYEPTGTGESPLADIVEWVNVSCPKCGGAAEREANTMPQWAGSCWYYLRDIDPKNNEALVDKQKDKYWSPVNFYVGGAEHATRHLIYARFWHKFLFDIGVVNYPEPFTRLQNVGLIMAEDGRKMSKRYGNIINPDDVVANYGADTLRVYEMFMGPFDQAIAWSTESIIGPRRFLEKVWKLQGKISDVKSSFAWPVTIKKVSEDIEAMKFNTAISTLMIAVGILEKEKINKTDYEILLKLLAPFAPHLTEELWLTLGNQGSIHESAWPEYEEGELEKKEGIIIVQVNGVKRDLMIIATGKTKEEIEKMALQSHKIAKWVEGKKIKKVIQVKGKLINIVV